MNLGAFSISLTVKDLAISRDFYQNLGFEVFAGKLDQNYLIMKNGNALIGLFQGMFEKNTLTFNPGWDDSAQEVEVFTDVREIQRILKERGIEIVSELDPSTTGPASILIIDPDGNPILIDQHV